MPAWWLELEITGSLLIRDTDESPADTAAPDRARRAHCHRCRRCRLVRVIIELGRILRLKTTAEGVKTLQQLAFLSRQGCGHVQGCLFGRPMPAAKFIQHIHEENEEHSGTDKTQASFAPR